MKMMWKKSVIYGKKFVGGCRITAGTNFQHTFRKYLPDPPGHTRNILTHGIVSKCIQKIFNRFALDIPPSNHNFDDSLGSERVLYAMESYRDKLCLFL